VSPSRGIAFPEEFLRPLKIQFNLPPLPLQACGLQ
jgi:hypothetical protein